MATGLAICLVPLVARNVAVGAKPLSMSGIGVSAFYLANVYGAPGTGWGRTRDYPEAMRRSGGRPMALLRETIASHPSVADPMTLLATKAAALVHYFEWTNNASPYYAERFTPLLRWATIPFWPILPLALMGLILTWSERRRLVWLYVAVLVPVLTVLAFYQTARLRLPIIVGLIPLAAATVEWLIARRGNVLIVLMVTIPMCVAVRWPGDKDPPRVQERDFAAGVDVLNQVGRHDAAIAEAREAVRRFPESPASRYMLIEALRAAARYDEAADVCDRAVQDFPDEAALRVCRADIHVDQNRPDLAVPLFRSVLRTKPRSAVTLMGLSRALTLAGRGQDPQVATRFHEQAIGLADRAVLSAPNDPEAYEVLARALLAAGQNARAAKVLKTGLEHTARTDPHRAILERLRNDLERS